MTCTIVLVSCVGKKADRPCPAETLYISPWFRKASSYAKQIADVWFILSAAHGLVEPQQVITPYEKTLNRMGVAEQRAWADRVWDDLKPRLQPDDQVVFLAGLNYRVHLLKYLHAYGCRVEIPMEGLRIGEQMNWLDKQMRSKKGK